MTDLMRRFVVLCGCVVNAPTEDNLRNLFDAVREVIDPVIEIPGCSGDGISVWEYTIAAPFDTTDEPILVTNTQEENP